jgi:hypothetical protein
VAKEKQPLPAVVQVGSHPENQLVPILESGNQIKQFSSLP